MTQTISAGCTDEQKAEWSDLLDRMSELLKKHEAALRQAGDFLRHALENPGDRKNCERLAWKSAQEAIDLGSERDALSKVYEAHPYTAEVQARGEAS